MSRRNWCDAVRAGAAVQFFGDCELVHVPSVPNFVPERSRSSAEERIRLVVSNIPLSKSQARRYLVLVVTHKLSEELRTRIAQVTNKRARLVLDTIAQKGSITTEELQKLGYEHAPRAARDVRELGFTLVTTMVRSDGGKRMARYSLSEGVEAGKTGRLQLPKKQRDAVIQACGGKCQICGATHDLQVDHRVPYQVAGESLKGTDAPYMVLDGTCNRRKSWICEHCPNLLKYKKVETCQSCYWANPDEHTHVALEEIRRIDVVFSGEETRAFDQFRKSAKKQRQSVPDRVKELVRESGK